MDRSRKVIGYGICGPGEAGRYMRETLEEFKRLCDDVVLLLNNPNPHEVDLVREYGFKFTVDNREWGKMQWKIKQDFVSREVAAYACEGDVMVALDMDERFDRHLTKEWLLVMPFDAYHTFVVDLWNDEQHYKPESCFWKVQIWRWNGVTDWVKKPLHCSLVPRWAAGYNRYAPFLQIHKGLMTKESRTRKIARYEKYDPRQQFLGKQYYWMLKTDTAEPFDEDALHATIEKEVATYKQTKPRALSTMAEPKGRYAYVRNPGGMTVDIPEKQLAETLKRAGFEFLGWAEDAEKAMEEMFSEDESPFSEGIIISGDTAPRDHNGSYQRPAAEEAAELAGLNAASDIATPATPVTSEGIPEAGETVVFDGIKMRNRTGLKERETIRKAAKKVAVKKTAKKARK